MKARHFVSALLFCALLLWSAPAAAQSSLYEELMIRLQVVASSDADADQQIKLGVRDAIREKAAALCAQAQGPDEAYELLKAHRAELCRAARRAARELGHQGNVRVEIGSFEFPTRIYAGVVVPSGEYRALRVTLGAGRGHNWWCVLYPDLCASDETAIAQLQENQGVRFYSSIGRAVSRLFGWEGAA